MPYTPGAMPQDAPAWVVREFLSVSRGIEEPRQITPYATLSVEPEKPREGMMVVAVSPWNPGYGFGPYVYFNDEWLPMFGASVAEAAIIACSDETTALTTGLKRTFYLPYDVEIDEVIADVVTGPTGSGLTADVKVGGASILSTKPVIEAGETSSLTGTAAVISSAAHSKGAKVTLHIDSVGTAAAGLKITLVWRRVS